MGLALNFHETQIEFVWEIVKYLICEQTDILIERHLDHLIICAFYAVSKKTSSEKEGKKTFADLLKE